MFQFSLNQYDLLFVFSGDADIGPAVERAQSNGAKVVAILSERQPATLIKKLVDGVIPLEAVIDLIEDKYIISRFKKPLLKNKGEMSV